MKVANCGLFELVHKKNWLFANPETFQTQNISIHRNHVDQDNFLDSKW